MSIILDGSLGITTPTYGGADTAEYITPVVGMKNRLINGSMMIDQRNAGASYTVPTGAGLYSIDRWQVFASVASKYSVQQNAGSVTPPTGFVNYLGVTSLSSYSSAATDEFIIGQKIEGLNLADLGWGTANAQTVTLSFWVRSSLTGTFGGAIQNSAQTRFYVFSYTVSSANTWEYKTITIAGDATGTWLTTNGIGIRLIFDIGTGSTYKGAAGSWGTTFYAGVTGGQSVVGTNGATWYITGVQLEKGSTATSFDYRPYGTELMLAQRYYFKDGTNSSLVYNGSGTYSSYQFKVSMRAAPTVTAAYTALSISTEGFYSQSGGVTGSSVIATAEL